MRLLIALGLLAAAPTAAVAAAPAVLTGEVVLRGAGCAEHVVTAGVGGFFTARSAPGRGEWDLSLVAGAVRLDRSVAAGSREVVQGWVHAGQRVTVRGCRSTGALALPVTFDLAAVDRPADVPARLVRVDVSGGRALRLDALGLDVTHDRSERHADVVLGSAAEERALRAAGLPFVTRIADLGAAERRAAVTASASGSPASLPSGRTTYRELADYDRELRDLAAAHPATARVVTLPGASVEGRTIAGIEIAENVHAADDGRPVNVVVAAHHAREWPSAESAMEYAHDLLLTRVSDLRTAALLRDSRTIIVPVLNPDGYAASRRAAPADPFGRADEAGIGAAQTPPAAAGLLSYRRKNCGGEVVTGLPCELRYGIDLNRNYGLNWGGPGSSADPSAQTYRGTGAWSEPETAAFHAFTQELPVTTLLTLHNVVGAVYEASDTSSSDPVPDADLLDEMGAAFAARTGYSHRPNDDTGGTTEDWNHFAAGTLGFTVELGPSGGTFHGPYARSVVEQYEGTLGRGGLREAFRDIGAYGADPRYHGVLTGSAPAGAVVTLERTFTTPSRSACALQVGACLGGTVPALDHPDRIAVRTVVADSGLLEWHVPPSTRPLTARDGGVEAYALECDGVPGAPVVVARGERVDLGALDCG